MPYIKVSMSEENYDKLAKQAAAKGCSIQDLVRSRLFEDTTLFSPEDAVARALRKRSGDIFTLPDLYPGEWTLPRGVAGIAGRQFFNLVNDHYANEIVYIGTVKRAKYRRA